MSEEFDRLERLLESGEFASLSIEDQHWVNENLGDEAAYNKLTKVVGIANRDMRVLVSPKVRRDLMKQFRQKHQPNWVLAVQWKIPAYVAVMAILTFSFLITWLIPAQERIVERLVSQEMIVDTIYVASKPDTVFIKQTIEKPIYITVYKERESEKSQVAAIVREPKGKSLADQSEIKDILVSGR